MAGLLPDVMNVRENSVHLAKAAVKQAVEEGMDWEKDIPTEDTELEECIREPMWDARYRLLRPVTKKEASKFGQRRGRHTW